MMLNSEQIAFCKVLARSVVQGGAPNTLKKGSFWAAGSNISNRPLIGVGSGTGFSHIFGSSPISTVPGGVSPRFAGGAGARRALINQAMQQVQTGRWSPKQARSRLTTSTARVKARVNPAPAVSTTPAGFGGSGSTGSVPNLGAPQTGGSYTPPPPRPIGA